MDIKELDIELFKLPFENWYNKEIEILDLVQRDLKSMFVSTLTDSKLLDHYYYSFKVLKKRGGLREIFAPTFELKEVQRKIADYLIFNKKQNLNVSFGFELNTNMVAGAMQHTNKEIVLNLDIKDFFKSINKKMIGESLKRTFNIDAVPWKFLEIVTLHGYLPTGAPSSPVLSNIYCYDMDLELLKFSKEYKLTYTRYADDFTFSTNEKINKKKIVKLITDIVEKYYFEINNEKTKVYNKSYRQEVTGLVVNEKVNLKREFRYNLKALLYNWKKYGYSVAEKKFNEKYPKKNFISTVKGWIEFYGMVKGKEDPQFKKFNNAFVNLHRIETHIATFNELLENNIVDEHS